MPCPKSRASLFNPIIKTMTGYHLHSLLTEILSKNIDIEFNDKDTIHSIKGKIGNIIEEISEPSEHSNEEDYYLQDYDLN